MNLELKQNHVWKNFSEMGYDNLKYTCIRFYARYFDWFSSKSC